MRKLGVLLALILAVGGCGRRASHPGPQVRNSDLRTVPLAFPDGKTVSAEVADTPQKRETGMMFRTELKPDDAMLFVFDSEQYLQFWMKNTFVDLDMVFIGADKRITAVHQDVPRSAADTPEINLARRSGRGKYVLELPAGTARRRGIKVGDALGFSV